MADKTYVIVDTNTQETREVRLKDNGDGTYSIATAEQYAPASENNAAGYQQVSDAMSYGTGPITASGLVITGPGRLAGYIVNSSSSGTLKAWDNTTGSSPVIHDTMALAVGMHMFPKPVRFATGLYLTVGGTISVTPVFESDL